MPIPHLLLTAAAIFYCLYHTRSLSPFRIIFTLLILFDIIVNFHAEIGQFLNLKGIFQLCLAGGKNRRYYRKET